MIRHVLWMIPTQYRLVRQTFLNVLANDTDPDNPLNPTPLKRFIQPRNGIATVQSDGRIAYRPTLALRIDFLYLSRP